MRMTCIATPNSMNRCSVAVYIRRRAHSYVEVRYGATIACVMKFKRHIPNAHLSYLSLNNDIIVILPSSHTHRKRWHACGWSGSYSTLYTMNVCTVVWIKCFTAKRLHRLLTFLRFFSKSFLSLWSRASSVFSSASYRSVVRIWAFSLNTKLLVLLLCNNMVVVASWTYEGK